jgi:hypothetical protein
VASALFWANLIRKGRPASPALTVEQQLRVVASASFQRRRLLSTAEYRVFKTIEEETAAAHRNSKRIHIRIVDRAGRPVVAVEYQGSGHYQGTAAIRDAVKKEALLKAGVRYVEVFANESSDQIRLLVREHLGWASTGRTPAGAIANG